MNIQKILKKGKEESSATIYKSKIFSRRFSIFAGILLAISFALTPISVIFARFLRPKQPSNKFGGMVSIGGLQNIPELNSSPENYPTGKFWLSHQKKGLVALYGNCTHLECLFAWDAQKNSFVCPCHGSEFSCDGKVLRGPAKRDLETFPISIIDEKGQTIRLSDEKNILPIADIVQKRKKQSENKKSTTTINAIEFIVNTTKHHR